MSDGSSAQPHNQSATGQKENLQLFTNFSIDRVKNHLYENSFFCVTKFKNSFYKSWIHPGFGHSITLL